MKTDIFQSIIKTLPNQPGIYKYFDDKSELLYVGKAKNLKKRVSSYFNKIHDSGKTNVLVKNIASLRFIVVETENVLLICPKDDEQQVRNLVNDVKIKKGEKYV